MFDRANENLLVRLSHGATVHTHTFISLFPDSHRKDITHLHSERKMYDTVVQKMAHRVVRRDMSAQVRHSDVSGQSGYHARLARSFPNERRGQAVWDLTRTSRAAPLQDMDVAVGSRSRGNMVGFHGGLPPLPLPGITACCVRPVHSGVH